MFYFSSAVFSLVSLWLIIREEEREVWLDLMIRNDWVLQTSNLISLNPLFDLLFCCF